MADILSHDEKRILLTVAREAIMTHLGEGGATRVEPTGNLGSPHGVFVTLHDVSRRAKPTDAGLLRGCIGYLETDCPLIENVRRAAVASAFRDSRFPPVLRKEITQLEIEISVLSAMSKPADQSEIKVGIHGLVIRKGPRSGLLLPQVAVEQKWDRETFLRHTCRKAGLPADAWKDSDTEIEFFRAVVFNERQFGTLRTEHHTEP